MDGSDVFKLTELTSEYSFKATHLVSNVTKCCTGPVGAKAVKFANLGDGWHLQWMITKGKDDTKFFGLFLAAPKKYWGSAVTFQAELRNTDGIQFASLNVEKVFTNELSWGIIELVSINKLLENLMDDAFNLVVNLKEIPAAVPRVDASRPQLSLSAAEAINRSLISPPDLRDIKFLNYTSKPNKDLKNHVRESFSCGSILADRTQYFSSHAAFSEGVELTTLDHTALDSMPNFDASYDYLSDSDLESVEDGPDEPTLAVDSESPTDIAEPSCLEQPHRDTKKWKVIYIGDVAHKTWVATLGFLHTDAIRFASLSSKETETTAIGGQAALAFPQVSCKSIFRVADKLGIKDLEELAFNCLKSQIDDETIFHEIFSSFTGRYDRVKDMEYDYLVANWDRLQASNQDVLQNMLSDIGSGKRPGSVWLLQRLFEKMKLPTA